MAITPRQIGYASVNGLDLYYEIHGAGRPLVLLHGGLSTIHSFFGQLLPVLAEIRQVIAVELQAHGHTADVDRPMSYEAMADDVAALVKHLALGAADVLGFSLGGGVAWQTAIRHPEGVRKLVVVSAPGKRQGWYPEVLAGMASINADAITGSPLHQDYLNAAPRPADWPVLIAKVRELLGKDYDWSASIESIKAPTLIVVGDADSVRTAHAVELFGLLGGGKTDGAMGGVPSSQLAVLPGTTHFTIMSRTDLLRPIVSQFLDAPMIKTTPQ
jgi:pimeloyl-ACP methyl ester carboxylesterase